MKVSESTSSRSRRLDAEFHRLAAELNYRGFEALRLDADTPEAGIVTSVLSIIDQMAALAGLIPGHGWHVEARHLRPGMVIDYSPFCTWNGPEPSQLQVLRVTPAEGPGMVRLHGQCGFVSAPVAADCPFEIRTVERTALEVEIVAAELAAVR